MSRVQKRLKLDSGAVRKVMMSFPGALLLNRIRKKQNRMATQAASAVRKILKRFSICTAEKYSGLPFFLFMDHTSNNCVVLFLDAQHIFAQDLRGNAGQVLKIGHDLALVKDDDAVADVD